ncbi:MAG: ABC transporter ATP-binding protein [Holophaga sp.]|nr:ABC transporter ATP-binding protein [Holophaga sp.]
MTPALEARGLTVLRGGVQVLDIPALELQAGAVLALIGPNGSGKTTLLKTLACLQEPASGSLRFQGQPLASRAAREAYRRRVTMVFQQPLLFDTTVARNLESGLKLHGVPAPQRARRVEQAALQFGITALLDRQARKLSGGEAQRTSLARAFALDPEILFLDEPFSALDPPTREALLDDLGAALRQRRTTAVLATHDQLEALQLADRLAVLHQGRIVQSGTGDDVVNHPASEFVAGFVGMETLLPGRVTASGLGLCRVSVAGREVEAVGSPGLGDAVFLGLRPEHVTLAVHEDPASSARNRFPGTVTRILPRGPCFKVELDCGFPVAAFVTPASLEALSLAPGSAVVAAFKATAVHLIRRPGQA